MKSTARADEILQEFNGHVLTPPRHGVCVTTVTAWVTVALEAGHRYFVTTVHVAWRMILLLGQRQGTISEYGNGGCSGTVKVEFERQLGQAVQSNNFVSNMMATTTSIS